MNDDELIRAAIEASGLSARRFATHIIARDERSVRRWLAGELALPDVLREWLERWMALSDATRSRIVGSLD